jgi:hypothetical protein
MNVVHQGVDEAPPKSPRGSELSAWASIWIHQRLTFDSQLPMAKPAPEEITANNSMIEIRMAFSA